MSIDVYRGLVMFLLLAEVLHLCAVASAVPDSFFWSFLCYHQSHAQWVGCHLHDLIQPSFTFLVGVSLPFSIAKRLARGDSFGSMARHAVIRSAVFIMLGIALLSVHSREIAWRFDDTLTQIGLGYGILFMLAFRTPRAWWAVFVLILLGDWLAFALYPLPSGSFDYAGAGVTADWLREHGLRGWEAHWQKNSNIAWVFDSWLLNLFPAARPYVSANGLTTLNFIPTLATMILGLAAGQVLRGDREPQAKARWLAVAGAVGLATGAILGWVGVCPVVKSIWTPSWVLFSGGWCFLLMACFYYWVDLKGIRRGVFPLVVVGMNSIAAYVMAHVYPALAFGSIRRVVGDGVFQVLGPAYQPVLYGFAVLLCYWLVLYGLYRARWFLRI